MLANNKINDTKDRFHFAAVVPKYSPLLYCNLFLLFLDLLINAFSELLIYSPIAQLIIYMYEKDMAIHLIKNLMIIILFYFSII